MYGPRARLGRINPSPETVGDQEWGRLCPDGVITVSTRMFIERVIVATSYIQPVDDLLAAALRAAGKDVVAIRGMGILKSIDMGDVEPETTERFTAKVLAEAGGAAGADGCLISCGNLRTLEAIAPLEAEFGLPVVTSNQAGLWQALRMAGIEANEVSGAGRLFATAGNSGVAAAKAAP